MFKNYLVTAWRNLVKGRMHSFINITGLAFGMAVAIMIGLWMYDELSYNKNFENHDRIARVIQNVTNNGEVQTWKSLPYPLAEELRKNYGSDFKYVVMCNGWGDHLLTINDKKLKQTGGYFEKDMPELFTLKMLRGKRNFLDDPSSIALSASAAKAYFGNEDPIDKSIKIDGNPDVKVAAVYEDFPRNSVFDGLNFIASWDFMYNNNEGLRTMSEPWRPNFVTIFVQLNENSTFAGASLRIKDAKLKRVNAQLQKKKPTLFLESMDRWHLYAEYKNGVNAGGAIQYVWMFGIIGVFVLLLACINFMNLSTARSEKRAKEVGIRKTVGSLRNQLILQFFNESLLTVFFAFALSLVLALIVLPFFNTVANKQMSIPWTVPVFWISALVFILLTAIVAGSYPALYLSSFKPVKVLKGTFRAGRFAAIPRKVLVVVQFTVSVTLIICTIVVYQQLQHAKNRPVGYSRNSLINIPLSNPSIHEHFEALRSDLTKQGIITSIAESEAPTTETWNSTSGFSWPGKDPNLSTDFATVSSSYDYGKTIGWQIKEGRDFSREFGTDTSAVILNEAAVRFMQLKKPVGEVITWWDQPLTVVGVVKDMVIHSPYDEVRPMVFPLSIEPGNVAVLRLNPSISAKQAMAAIEPLFKKYNPEQPFEYSYVDENYARKFGDEERVGKLAGFFALLAIAISCLGLFGLTSFVAEQRKKEIGIRKVLGASVFTVWNLLSRDFVILVAISFVLAVPLSYYFMNGWLQGYTYRTSLVWWVFAIGGILALVITMITVSFQAIRAAISKPVKSLRTE